MSERRHVEVLTFAGCPNAESALAVVERVVAALGVDAQLERVDVRDADEAVRLRFLGSPSVRVDGRDVEPGAEERSDYAFCCRIYRTERGLAGRPDERWLRQALSAQRPPGA